MSEFYNFMVVDSHAKSHYIEADRYVMEYANDASNQFHIWLYYGLNLKGLFLNATGLTVGYNEMMQSSSKGLNSSKFEDKGNE